MSKKPKIEIPAPTPEHRAAIDRLSTKPGECATCGETLVCCIVEEWRGDGHPHPEPRFACEDHDVWLGDCFDEVEDTDYKGGLYLAVLRDVSDPWWRWLPEHMRAAAAKYGFSVRYPNHDISWRVTRRGDRAWVTDGCMMIELGDLAEGEAALDRSGRVRPQFPRETETKLFRIPEERVAPVFETLSMAIVADVTEHATMKDAAMLGSVAVARHYLDFGEAVFPGIRWYITGGLDPVFGMQGRDLRAVVMPLRTE